MRCDAQLASMRNVRGVALAGRLVYVRKLCITLLAFLLAKPQLKLYLFLVKHDLFIV